MVFERAGKGDARRVHVNLKCCSDGRREDESAVAALETWAGYIRSETLAVELRRCDIPPPEAKLVTIGGTDVFVAIERV